MQEFYLLEKGYIVIDFWYHKMVNLFLRNQRVLSEKELRDAFLEIKFKLQEFGLKLKKYDSTLINQET